MGTLSSIFGSSLGTQGSLLNQLPSLANDGNSVARYDRNIPEGVVKDANGVESIYWDLMVGSNLRGMEQVSGAIVLYAVYEITATTADFFYVGCQVGDIFPCGVVKTCSATNKVKRVLGNHLTQPTFAKRPIDGLFAVAGVYMKTAPFTWIQPEAIYEVIKINGNVNNVAIHDGNGSNSGIVHTSGNNFAYDTYTPSTKLVPFAGSYPFSSSSNTYVNLGAKILLKAGFNGASCRFRVGKQPIMTGNCGTSNMGGFTLGTVGGIGTTSKMYFDEAILRKIDSESDENVFAPYFTKKYKLRAFGFIGDSTISFANGGVNWHPVWTFMSHNFQSFDLSAPGQTIAMQLTALNTYITTQDIDAFIVQVGLNDLLGDANTLIAAYQNLINVIRTKIGASKKIIISTMIPCNRADLVNDPNEAPRWYALNDAILGIGATPITGVDGRVNTIDTALNAGDNTLNPLYDTGDGVHENDLGRQLIANLWDAELTRLGL